MKAMRDIFAVEATVRLKTGDFTEVFNLSDDLRPGKLEVQRSLRESAFGLGLDASTVARQLRTALQGATVDKIQVGGESHEIDVQLQPDDQNTLADLESFYFTRPNGNQVPLSSVAQVQRSQGWSRIARINSRRVVTHSRQR